MEVVLIIDCGSTSIRVCAVDTQGRLLASARTENTTTAGHEKDWYHVWDMEAIWQRICRCCQRIIVENPDLSILALAVTSFGVDGAPFDARNRQLYPVIAWKCPRTVEIVQSFSPLLAQVYRISGVNEIAFNTLYKLIWLKNHQPQIYKEMKNFVFISSIINHRLTGRLSTDRTMAGTSMLTAMNTRTFSPEILKLANLDGFDFPEIVEAGEAIGTLTTQAASALGIGSSIPVISAGHDTQFALFGSGADIDEPVLSSGTWEILTVRSREVRFSNTSLKLGITTEFDAIPGLLDPSILWLSSGLLEWLGQLIYPRQPANSGRYKIMEKEAAREPAGSRGVRIEGQFLTRFGGEGEGRINGLSTDSKRSTLYRAALETLSLQLRSGLAKLQRVSEFKTRQIICVGGGSRNQLFNQIRADITGLPIKVVEEAETTVLGAAMFAYVGSGYYDSIELAKATMMPRTTIVRPGANRSVYIDIFKENAL